MSSKAVGPLRFALCECAHLWPGRIDAYIPMAAPCASYIMRSSYVTTYSVHEYVCTRDALMYANLFRTAAHILVGKSSVCCPCPSSPDPCPVKKSHDQPWYAVRRDGRLHCQLTAVGCWLAGLKAGYPVRIPRFILHARSKFSEP